MKFTSHFNLFLAFSLHIFVEGYSKKHYPVFKGKSEKKKKS